LERVSVVAEEDKCDKEPRAARRTEKAQGSFNAIETSAKELPKNGQIRNLAGDGGG
jgi:hypothetical protein